MNAVRLRRLSKPAVLKRIGRDLLARFFARFEKEWQREAENEPLSPALSPLVPPAVARTLWRGERGEREKTRQKPATLDSGLGTQDSKLGTLDSGLRTQGSFALPPPETPDAEYFRAVSALLMRPEALPAALNEALCAIDELSSEQGNAVLEADHEWPSKMVLVKPDSTREEIALQLWLADADYVVRVCNKLRLRRLTAFEHAAHPRPGVRPSSGAASLDFENALEQSAPAVPSDVAATGDGRAPRLSFDRATILALTLDLDAWFLQNGRGSETTRVEVYPMEREYWFLIRHGDLFTRAPKVEQQETHILHFRPERDDVVVYSPALDELRVNARTQGERDLYIRQFGLHLRGSGDYFSDRSTYTLEPLRTAGADALDPREIEGVEKIRLRELETADLNGDRQVITRAVQGLFEFAAANPDQPDPIAKDGHLARAIFDIQFTGSAKAFPVEIRLPNMLKVSRNCDAALVQDWLMASGFRRGAVADSGGAAQILEGAAY